MWLSAATACLALGAAAGEGWQQPVKAVTSEGGCKAAGGPGKALS